MNKAIIFGPWVGEFSYELSWWVPEARKIRNQLKDHHSVHVGYFGRRGLYKDFIDDYIAYPAFLQEFLKYPSMTCVVENNSHVIPGYIYNFYNSVIDSYKRKGFEVKHMLPGPLEIPFDPNLPGVPIPPKVFRDLPFGEYKHLESDPKIDKIIQKKLSKFKHKRPIVVLNARLRTRGGKTDYGDWNAENWTEFISRIIKNLKLNVILMGVPKKGDMPGSLSRKEAGDLSKYEDYLMDMVFEGEDSVDYQISLLKNTKASIYGMSAAVILAFFTNTPVFTHQSKEHSRRINFQWQKNLTDNHKWVHIFDKYPRLEYPESPVDEVYEEFVKFWTKLNKAKKL